MNTTILHEISKSIKESKWLFVEYLNQQGVKTNFWCAIQDVDYKNKALTVTNYNLGYIENESKGVMFDTKLFIDSILKASVVNHTTYEQNPGLIAKIESSNELSKWLDFDLYSENIVKYIKDCIKYDTVSYQKNTSLVSGINESFINERENEVLLTLSQVAELTESLEKLAKKDIKRNYQLSELVINLLSISTHRGLFLVAYKELLFDPSSRKLRMSNKILFNYEFASNEKNVFKHNLKNYLDIETEDFVDLFKNNRTEAVNMLQSVINKKTEQLDSRPYIMDIFRGSSLYIEQDLDSLISKKASNSLSKPLEAFFGNMSVSKLSRKRKFDIVLLDAQVNLNQIRAIHNALKQPITYVQGPPGTGKTKSIVNTIISVFFNNQSVLVSSNNNKPIDDIYDKLMSLKSKNNTIPFPILRLGNNEKLQETLKNVKRTLDTVSKLTVYDDTLDKIALSNKNKMEEVNDLIDSYERKLELKEEIEVMSTLLDSLPFTSNNIKLQTDLSSRKSEYESIDDINENQILNLIIEGDQNFLTWLFFTSVSKYKRLLEPKYSTFREILDLPDDDEKVKTFNNYIKMEENLKLLLRVFPIVITTNMSAYRLGSPNEHFDLVIMDESGQCSIGYALLPIMRGKRLMLVGDQNQLQPVIALSPESNQFLMRKHAVRSEYNYADNSILKLMITLDTVSKFILLNQHYRCDKNIIDFSNIKYYQSKLIINSDSKEAKSALGFVDVNQKKTTRSNERNTSMPEIKAIIEDIKKNKSSSIGIITPFRNQADMIKKELADQKITNVDVGTIHTFQGDEKDLIYISTSVNHHSSNKTFDWIKNNKELINVATTRAKKRLVLVTDYKELKKRSKKSTNDFMELATYMKKNGRRIQLTEDKNQQIINGSNYQQYNTKKEKELLQTLNHILSMEGKYVVEKQVKMSLILNRYTEPELFDYGVASVFDFVIFRVNGESSTPVLVIELDGEEHTTNEITKKRDSMKEQICKDNNIELVRIPNNYTRRYVFIKDLIERFLI